MLFAYAPPARRRRSHKSADTLAGRVGALLAAWTYHSTGVPRRQRGRPQPAAAAYLAADPQPAAAAASAASAASAAVGASVASSAASKPEPLRSALTPRPWRPFPRVSKV